MAVKIRLKRLGKIRAPYYRVVVADSRTKRDGRAIEEIGKYHPTEEPSLIDIDSERAQYWLGVGAQPTEQVMALLKVTGDWQKFKGLPGAEGTLRVAEPKADKKIAYEAAAKDSGEPTKDATTPRKKAAKKAEAPAEEAPARPDARRGRRGSGRRGSGCRGSGRRGVGRRGEGRGLIVLADALEHLVRGIVDHPDDVRVKEKSLRRGALLEVRVHPEDLGRVIGRAGRTAKALRTVIGAVSTDGPVRVDVVDVDRAGRR